MDFRRKRRWYFALVLATVGVLIFEVGRVSYRGSDCPPCAVEASRSGSIMPSTWPRVLLLGDSLTQHGWNKQGGWAAAIASELQRKADVINRGFSGYTTHSFKAIMKDVVTADIVQGAVAATLFLGANDANIAGVANQQHVPLPVYKENLVYIIDYLGSLGLTPDKIIVIPCPPNDPPTWKAASEKKHGRTYNGFPKTNEVNREYYDAASDVAKRMGTKFVELWDDLNSPEMFHDGLHFSEKGGDVLFSLVWPHLDELTSQLRMQQKYWADMPPYQA